MMCPLGSTLAPIFFSINGPASVGSDKSSTKIELLRVSFLPSSIHFTAYVSAPVESFYTHAVY